MTRPKPPKMTRTAARTVANPRAGRRPDVPFGRIVARAKAEDEQLRALVAAAVEDALRHAVRMRRHPAPRPPSDIGFAVRLTFDRPFHGPVALGYGWRFGLQNYRLTAAGRAVTEKSGR